jgi:hypothetical protein
MYRENEHNGEGDLERAWREGQIKAAKRERKFNAAMKRVRKNSRAAWICSLKEGDEVIVRFPWRDKDCPGGKTTRAWVKWVRENRLWVHWMTFNGDIGQDGNLFYKPHGGGGPYHVLEHPTIKTVYTAKWGYVFEDEWERLKRYEKGWETRRARARAQ